MHHPRNCLQKERLHTYMHLYNINNMIPYSWFKKEHKQLKNLQKLQWCLLDIFLCFLYNTTSWSVLTFPISPLTGSSVHVMIEKWVPYRNNMPFLLLIKFENFLCIPVVIFKMKLHDLCYTSKSLQSFRRTMYTWA